jgi:hypothetical protein
VFLKEPASLADKHARKEQQNKTRKIEQENTYGNVQKRNHVQDTEKKPAKQIPSRTCFAVLEGICFAGFFFAVLEGICFAGFFLYLARDYVFVRFHMCKMQKKPSEVDSFKNMRVITSYTPEDGHIGRNM